MNRNHSVSICTIHISRKWRVSKAQPHKNTLRYQPPYPVPPKVSFGQSSTKATSQNTQGEWDRHLSTIFIPSNSLLILSNKHCTCCLLWVFLFFCFFPLSSFFPFPMTVCMRGYTCLPLSLSLSLSYHSIFVFFLFCSFDEWRNKVQIFVLYCLRWSCLQSKVVCSDSEWFTNK